MRVLGISPSLALSHENMFDDLGISGSGHDSAAVLIHDGFVEAAIEQERLDRIKHSNKAPIEAIRFCLQKANIGLKDIDYIAVSYKEDTINSILKDKFLKQNRQKEYKDVRYYIQRFIFEACGEFFDQNKIIFVPHNEAHAESAYLQSGFEDCLVFITDGMGDDSAGMIQSRRNGNTELLYTISVAQSLGLFYINAINYLGYRPNDEYKVMGLAPYGDYHKYKRYFNKIVNLLPEGKYEIKNYYSLLFDIEKPRRKGEPFLQIHKDIAAAIQKTLEETILYVLAYYQSKTGHTNLCLAGGVAHNCSANGKIIENGLFTDVFIQPAAHDAGAVLGAALAVYNQSCGENPKPAKLEHVYWGTDIGCSDDIKKTLDMWESLISYKKVNCIEEETAKLLASGKIIGWVQGNSEFGPRALGNRSIIADPRPEENKKIINQMVKKRESYRPFAPSVLEEHMREYFEIPSCHVPYDYMNAVLKVKEDKRALLGAITHIDGTARIQSVSQKTNPRYWELICQFAELTGVHVILNTSFNNNCEPIVDSVEDAIVCYLTTKLHHLVIGDYLIEKKNVEMNAYLDMTVSLPTYVRVQQSKSVKTSDFETEYSISVNYDSSINLPVSKLCFEFLMSLDESSTMKQIMNRLECKKEEVQLIEELIELWENRLIIITPHRDSV